MDKYTYYQLLINKKPVRKLNSTIPHKCIFQVVSWTQNMGYPFKNYLANQIHLKKITTNYPLTTGPDLFMNLNLNLIHEQTEELYELFSIQTIQMLIFHGYNPTKDLYSNICAIEYKQYDLLKYLFSVGAPTSPNFDEWAPPSFNRELILFFVNNDQEGIENYFNNFIMGTDLLLMGQGIAASNGNFTMYKMFNNMGNNYCSTISCAARHKQKSMFRHLVNIHNSRKCICWNNIKISAAKNNDLPVVKYLVEDGADKNYMMKLAIEYNAIYIVEWLVDSGVDVDVICE